ncbi:MAG: hypothetical protein E6Q89_06885 [Bacteroidia bacterium]|nr:MAG: hypothetical protein E6Q89_06885 [Bacteroidia bacterium]
MKTKIYVMVCFILGIMATGCLKTSEVKPCTPIPVEQEKAVMQKFATDNAFNMTTDPSGLMYEILNQGTGAAITTNTNIKMKYIGKNMNGQKFDEGTTTEFYPVRNFIVGFQLGLIKLNGGGKVRIITPSSLAYGCAEMALKNQPLFFEVEITEAQ